jgi:hypothetical protein
MVCLEIVNRVSGFGERHVGGANHPRAGLADGVEVQAVNSYLVLLGGHGVAAMPFS